MTQEGEAPWDDGAMTRCTRCYKDTAVWGHDGKCPDCIAATTSFGKEVITKECGCEQRGQRFYTCQYHQGVEDAQDTTTDLHETIKAREREATDLRYRVRELNRYLERQQELYDNAQAERDEWKAKAEAQERQHEAWKLRAERKDIRITALEKENDALQDAVKHLREQIPDTHYCCMHMRWETREGAEV